jgi:phospholipid/cholesterol/gamma-HCH transport system substrate-binding protein
MKMKPVQTKRAVIVGIFIFLGLIVFIAGVLIAGQKRKTFEKTISVKAMFDNVNGLLKGNNIWFSGVKIGTVKKIKLIKKARVEVEMDIDEDSQDLIYKDAKVKIGSDGLIGNKIIIIYGGTEGMPAVQPGDTLAVENLVNSEQMMNTLEESNKNLAAITNDFKMVSKRLAEGQGTMGRLLTEDSLMNSLQMTAAALQVASLRIQMFTSNISDYSAKLNTKGSLTNDLVTDTSFFNTLKAAAWQIQDASINAKELTHNLKLVSYNLKDSSNLAGVLFNDKQAANNLRITVENLQSGTKKFDEDMEALQHNFLFRGFFKKRARQQEEQKKLTTNR